VFERLLAETRPHFTTFIRELRAALAPDKRIFLVLQPKTDNAIGDRGRVVDWCAVAPHVDYIRVMAYYDAWATSEHGPAVPMDQLRRLADYMLNDPQQSIQGRHPALPLRLGLADAGRHARAAGRVRPGDGDRRTARRDADP
jgi:spore germination protein YaaH